MLYSSKFKFWRHFNHDTVCVMTDPAECKQVGVCDKSAVVEMTSAFLVPFTPAYIKLRQRMSRKQLHMQQQYIFSTIMITFSFRLISYLSQNYSGTGNLNHFKSQTRSTTSKNSKGLQQ